MINTIDILLHFYPEDTPLRALLLKHSLQVRNKALTILSNAPVACPKINLSLVIDGAMLHDIGISQCQAPSILCMGNEPYITHGIIGAAMLRQYGAETGLDLEAFARICERHTGAGLDADEIRNQRLPLPEADFLPETPEEMLVCLADKFYSKSGDLQEKSLSKVRHSLEKFGDNTLKRFDRMCYLFGVNA